ncbi:mitochondrial fission ELM1 family protein [Methylophilaceae bacterium]|nr:mitochondrial fission ELM1 family protein [Methylophilaceae bacterium]
MKKSITIWRVIDGIYGHEKQSKSLTSSLSKIINTKIIDLSVKNLWVLIVKNYFIKNKINKPKFIIGAGHKTHMIIFLCKLVFGGKTILIMKPSLPINWFDLCFIPYHDHVNNIEKKNIVKIYGALNSLRNLGKHNPKRGLILIGGNSKYFNWDNNNISLQIKSICKTYPDVQYYLTTSRRTPSTFLKSLVSMNIKNIEITSWSEVDNLWIEKRLNECKKVSVTIDSISMIYEAISAGGQVSIIDLIKKKENKISREVERLISKKILRKIGNNEMKEPKIIIKESDRCAVIIKNKFLKPSS